MSERRLVHSVRPVEGDENLQTIEAEFYTRNHVIWGRIRCPESRLSDHLNGSARYVEVSVFHAEHVATRRIVELSGAHARINKSELLFVLPLKESPRPPQDSNVAWSPKMTKRCWVAAGPYSLAGALPFDSREDTSVVLRWLDAKAFHPITLAAVHFPDGNVRDYPAVIINQQAVEILALIDGD